MSLVLHEKVEEGLFVYQIIRSDRVRIRSYPELDDSEDDVVSTDGGNFEENELLAVDLIQPASHATFLRLADQSGWVVADEKGEVYLRQIPVETGLFSFFVDNVPSGIAVRRHPMDDSSDLLTTEADHGFRLEPMQRIYCDAVTQHPITRVKFFRLQCWGKGAPATPGWVYDRKPAKNENELDIHMLLDANKVKTGLFAYRALCGAVVRHRPNCSESSKTAKVVLADEIVVVDIIRESPYDNGNGPFLRLADGSGWLFEQKLGQRAMKQVPMESGKWVLSVLNDPVGMRLRKQPIDSQEKVFDTIYEFGALVECDRKLTNPAGVNFYRVRGTTGWLFDERDGVPMLNLQSSAVTKKDNDDKLVELPAWEPSFVRGIAATVDNVKEVSFQTAGQILTFDNADGIQIKVFCTTRTVCIIFQHSSKGTVKHFLRNCTPQDVLNTLRMELVDAILAYDRFESEQAEDSEVSGEEKKDDASPGLPQRSAIVRQEETLRIRLLVCESEITATQAKRRDLIASIKDFDDRRAKTAAFMKEEAERHRLAQVVYERPPLHMSPKAAEANQKDIYKRRGIVMTGTSNSLVEKSYRSSRSYESGDSESSCSSSPIREEARPATASSQVSFAPSSNTSNAKRTYVCGECFRSFSGKYSRDMHCRNVHKIFCKRCDTCFPSVKQLDVHRTVANHW